MVQHIIGAEQTGVGLAVGGGSAAPAPLLQALRLPRTPLRGLERFHVWAGLWSGCPPSLPAGPPGIVGPRPRGGHSRHIAQLFGGRTQVSMGRGVGVAGARLDKPVSVPGWASSLPPSC